MNRKLSARQKRSSEEWKARLLEWKKSGLSQSRYCSEKGLNLRTFQYWRRKFNKVRHPEIQLKKDQSVKIVRIKPKKLSSGELQTNHGRSAIKVHFSDVSIELDNNFSQDALLRLIRVLKTV